MSQDPNARSGPGFNRRDFIKGSGAAIAATAAVTAAQEAIAQDAPAKISTAGPHKVTLQVNGKTHELMLEPRVVLLDALRNDLNLTSCKEVCDRSACGACTVLIDGKPIYACTRLAIECQGQKIETTESLANGDGVDVVIDKFVEHDGMQCGFCTPGFAMAVRGFCNMHPKASKEDCRKGLGGNICRCGTYDGVLNAAYEAAQKGGA
ncbi:MAG: (2Fe-2S)-binding protein [Planctomycetaceae bacterium]|nr:(2Fe-2S)-binding protein [Planctomycetaceae bacterium]